METLPYARPMPEPHRPAMYRLVITLVLAGGVIMMGIGASVAFIAIILQPHGWPFAIAPFLAATLLLFVGIRSMWAASQYLRGRIPPDEKAERWIFTIHAGWF